MRRLGWAMCGALAAVSVLAGCSGGPTEADPSASHRATAAPSPSASRPSPSPSPTPVTYPLRGSGTYSVAAGDSAVLGRSGSLLRFRVAVEHGIDNLPAATFADDVVTILGDRRGWTAGGDVRLQRVGPGRPYDFTVYLVTPATRDVLCGTVFDRYTSCQNGNSVVVNVSRWVHAVPYYAGDLTGYREYAISHEVGHRLGHGHELCPGKGRPAPTMEQQTLGLHGCTAQPWPYPGGKRYAGPSGEYPLVVPTDPKSYYRTD